MRRDVKRQEAAFHGLDRLDRSIDDKHLQRRHFPARGRHQAEPCRITVDANWSQLQRLLRAALERHQEMIAEEGERNILGVVETTAGKDQCGACAVNLLPHLARRLADQDLTLELTPQARALVVREGTDPAYGARPLKRTIQRLVENPLARALVAGEFKPGDRITADADLVSGTIVFSSEGRTVVADQSRRDARRRADDEAEPVGAGAGTRRSSPFDLPDARRDDDDGGELLN